METILSVAAMRNSDAAAIASGTPGRELMRRAAEGIFRAACWKPPVTIVCGSGNNAGDGYAVALMMAEAGIACTLLIRGKKFTPDGKYWFDRCLEKKVPVRLWQETETLEGSGSVLDCIFGTGFHGAPEGEDARMIRLINASGAYVVSADINSGLNGDSGMAEEAVRSDLTVSIGSWKPGLFLNMAADLMKEKVNCDIGIPPLDGEMARMEASDAAALFPPRLHFSHKGDYGYIALIGGSFRYSGAIRLAAMANAAMRSGAGVVRLCSPRSLCEKMMPEILEATLFPLSETAGDPVFREEEFREALKGTRAAAFGMGIGNTKETREAVQYLLREYGGTLILDADGLNALAADQCRGLKERSGKVILTPHLGEFSRLSGNSVFEIQQHPVETAKAFAEHYGVIVLVKGPGSIITDGTRTIVTDRGAPGMATAGSGDVLSGILAAVTATHQDRLLEATAAAAWINGRAGEMAQERVGAVSMTAGDTVATLPEVIREITARS